MIHSPPTVVGALDEIADLLRRSTSSPSATGGAEPRSRPPDRSTPATADGGPQRAAAPGQGAPEGEGEGAEISSAFPYQPRFVEVKGSQMHYVELGEGDPVLFLHGNPAWSYVWRNVIPHVSPFARCIAPDLIGFGRSDKPDIDYRWFDHVEYVEGFIAELGLENLTLVVQDQGSGFGFHYAMRHEDNVKGIAFFEAMLRPYPEWERFPTGEASEEFRQLFRAFRIGGKNGKGWKLIVEQNLFVEQLLPQVAGRPLGEEEMAYYREPFREPKSRKPIWRFPREIPIEGKPKDVWEAVSSYSEGLQQSTIPKLLIHADPGAILTSELVEWSRENLSNLETVDLGQGLHFLQESHPHELGRALAEWYRRLPSRRSPDEE